MGIEFKLSDRELPASPAFIAFLDRRITGVLPPPSLWADQTREEMARGRRHGDWQASASRVMADVRGRERVARAYSLLAALLVGNREALLSIQSAFRFVCVTGIPRSGGSYLTAELYRSIGLDPATVPDPVAHDSFPEAGPVEGTFAADPWIDTVQTTAEYLTMVETFYAEQPRLDGKIIVPKKLTQAAYCGAFFVDVFGPDLELIITLRHPVAACLSTYELSGGLPSGRRFAVRSNIEHWCQRDLLAAGGAHAGLGHLEYFDAYLRYWEHYHLRLATTGLGTADNVRLIAYGAGAMQAMAGGFHKRHRSDLAPAPFRVSDRAIHTHPDWLERARPAIARVAAIWRSVGLEFPEDDIAACT